MTDNQDIVTAGAVQPTNDRPLTAGDVLWMVHVLGPDEIYPAPDHTTAVDWCDGINSAIPDSDVLCVAVPALWTGSSKDHAAGLKDARDAFSTLSRPATSAASEVEGVVSKPDAIRAVDACGGTYSSDEERSGDADGHREALTAALSALAALASPPVSERERELEGALREAVEFIDGLGAELLNERTADWYPEGANNAASHMSEAMRLAGNRCADYQALTAQPQ